MKQRWFLMRTPDLDVDMMQLTFLERSKPEDFERMLKTISEFVAENS